MSKEQEKLRKRLSALLKLPENRFCCECGQKQPQWASTNLGVFFCIRCSGIHRALGVHISTVRSTTLDNWKSEWVDNMEKWGNARGNAYWEAGAPGSRKPHENVSDQVLDQFIRDKYIRGAWKAKNLPSFDKETGDLKSKPIQSRPAVVSQKPTVSTTSYQDRTVSAKTTTTSSQPQNDTQIGDDFAAFFDDAPVAVEPSAPSSTFSLDSFFSNSTSTSSTTAPTASSTTSQPAQQPTTIAAKKPTTTSDIMSLFSTPAPIAPATVSTSNPYYPPQQMYTQPMGYPQQSMYPPQSMYPQQLAYPQPQQPQQGYGQQPMYYAQPIYTQPVYGQPNYNAYPQHQYNPQAQYTQPGNMYSQPIQPQPQRVSTTTAEKDPFADLF